MEKLIVKWNKKALEQFESIAFRNSKQLLRVVWLR